MPEENEPLTLASALQHLAVFMGGVLLCYLIVLVATFQANPASWDELARMFAEALLGAWIVVYVDAVRS